MSNYSLLFHYRFPTLIICLGVSDDIDVVIWVKNVWIISTLFSTLIA